MPNTLTIQSNFMNNILVTGSNGQLGSELKKIFEYYDKFIFFFTDSNELDIRRYDEILDFVKINNINVIINCAAYTDVEKAENEKELANNINNIAVKLIAKICRENKIKLIHLSTDFVFDGLISEGFYKEYHETNPCNIYGMTKLLGEKQIFSESPKNSIIIRTSWLYSSFGNNFYKKIIELCEKMPEISVVSDHFGSPTNAHDLAKAILEIIPKIKNNQPEIYHYSNLGECSWYEFSKEIIKFNKLKNKIKPIGHKHYVQKAKRPNRSVLCKDKIINRFNLKILDWKESLKQIKTN